MQLEESSKNYPSKFMAKEKNNQVSLMQSVRAKICDLRKQAIFVFSLALAFNISITQVNAEVKSEEEKADKDTKIVKQVTKAVYVKDGKKTTHITESVVKAKGDIPIECIKPHTACKESKVVIDTLMKISKAYSHGDFDAFASYLDDEVTIFDKRKKKVIVGKDAVLADVKRRWQKAHVGPKPVISYTIEHPYAKVMGNTAVVTFKAIKVIGGSKKPKTYISKSTDVFVKKDGQWKKLHYISDWKKAKS